MPPPTNQVVYLGDSIMAGNHVSAGQDLPSKLSATYPPIASNALNLAIPSTYANEDGTHTDGGQGATADSDFNSGVAKPICVVFFGANDLVLFTGATFFLHYKAYCQARAAAGYQIIACTVLPNSTITGAGNGAQVGIANSLIRGDTSFYASLADLGSDPIMGNASNNGNATYYSDGVHPTDVGNDLLEPYILRAIYSALGVTGISPDTSGGAATNGTTSQSLSLTVGVGATALFAAVTGDMTDAITGATWNGVSMTLVKSFSNNRWLYLFYLASPAAGSHTLLVSASSSIYIGIAAASYFGSSTTGQPEAFAFNGLASATVGVLTNQAWTIAAGKNESGGVAAANPGTVLRAGDGFAGGSGITGLVDSNAACSTGANSLAVQGAAANPVMIIVSLAPSSGPAPTPGSFQQAFAVGLSGYL